MRRWLQDDRRRWPLAERAVYPARMEDEGNPPILELPADRRAVGSAEIEIQDACRQMRMVGQPKRLIQMRRGKHPFSGALQAPGKVEADQRLIFHDENRPSH